MKSAIKLLTTRKICPKIKQRYLEIANNAKNYYQYYENVTIIILIVFL